MSKLERIAFIDQSIRDHGGIRLTEIIVRFEVSERQAKRDIEYLRNRLNAPLIWDKSKKVYCYESSWQNLAFIDTKALLFLVFARTAAGTLAYIPFSENISLKQFLAPLPKSMRSLEKAIRYELPGWEPVDAELISVFLDAINKSTSVELKYRDIEERESLRKIFPRRIINYAGAWYCAAWDPSCDDLRIFRFHRIISTKVIGPSQNDMINRGPDDDTLDSRLDGNFGMFKGAAERHVIMRFTGKAREIVKGEIWHRDQIIREGVNQTSRHWYELELPVSSWDEILGRLLRFGADGEAVAPPEFRAEWLRAIDKLSSHASECRNKDSSPGEEHKA